MANVVAFHGITLTGEGKKYVAEINKLISKEVHIGYQAGDNAYDDGTDLVDVVAYNEFGTSTIPARPFMKQSFENHPDKLNAECGAAVASINNGGSAEAALTRIGVFAKGLIQEEIVEGGFAPNAPSTIRKKGSAQPLIDTGFMRENVNYFIKDAD